MNNLSIFMQTARRLLHTLPPLPLGVFVQGKESVPVRKFLVLACLALLPTVASAQDRIRYVYDAAGNRVRREAAVSVQKAMARRQSVISEETSQPDMLRERSIRIGPNPTDGLLRASISGDGENGECSLYVYTPQGVLILAKQVKDGSTDIDITNCPAGVYLVKITVNNSSTTWKIVKK